MSMMRADRALSTENAFKLDAMLLIIIEELMVIFLDSHAEWF